MGTLACDRSADFLSPLAAGIGVLVVGGAGSSALLDVDIVVGKSLATAGRHQGLKRSHNLKPPQTPDTIGTCAYGARRSVTLVG